MRHSVVDLDHLITETEMDGVQHHALTEHNVSLANGEAGDIRVVYAAHDARLREDWYQRQQMAYGLFESHEPGRATQILCDSLLDSLVLHGTDPDELLVETIYHVDESEIYLSHGDLTGL